MLAGAEGRKVVRGRVRGEGEGPGQKQCGRCRSRQSIGVGRWARAIPCVYTARICKFVSNPDPCIGCFRTQVKDTQQSMRACSDQHPLVAAAPAPLNTLNSHSRCTCRCRSSPPGPAATSAPCHQHQRCRSAHLRKCWPVLASVTMASLSMLCRRERCDGTSHPVRCAHGGSMIIQWTQARVAAIVWASAQQPHHVLT